VGVVVRRKRKRGGEAVCDGGCWGRAGLRLEIVSAVSFINLHSRERGKKTRKILGKTKEKKERKTNEHDL
jgi:hypothetical protein